MGQTDRFEVNDLLCQGSTWAPLKTSATVDTIGKDSQESGENVYLYKESVKVPPLSFIDNIAAISKCGVESLVTNSVINAKIQTKKLRFGPNKCHQMQHCKKRLMKIHILVV